jgi:hypothetical protein
MSRYRIWIITGLALLAWLLVFAVGTVIWNGISGSGEAVPGAGDKAPTHSRAALEDPG